MGVRLPSEYQEVQYLDSTSTAAPYIDTGIPITEDLTFEIDFQLSDITSRMYFMGGYNGTDFYLYVGISKYFQTAFGATYNDTTLTADIQRHKFIYQINNGTLIVKDSSTTILTKNISSFSGNSILVAGTTAAQSASIPCKTFESKMTKAGVVIQDLIPCYRKSDSKPGMYDLVTNQFFTNAGTGDFLVGPDVLGSISPLMVAWRRMLMRKSSPIPTGYVTDGLLLWLDAICNTRNGHDANALYWEDLSVNHRDYAIGESGLIFGQSVVSFTTVNHKAITTEKAFTSAEQQQIRDNLATIEIGVDFAGSGYQIVLALGNQHGTINFCNLSGSRTLNFNPNSTSESVSLLGGLHGYNSELWVDGVKQESTDFSTTWTNVRLNLMFSYIVTGQYSFIGDIAYIRVYNRRLTDAELMQNWLRDKARYNL